jgi:hypothetical protein
MITISPCFAQYSFQVIEQPNGNQKFMISPEGYYEWYNTDYGGNKLNTKDTSYYLATSSEFVTGPEGRCPDGKICLYAVDRSSMKHTMRPVSSISALEGMCSNKQDFLGASLLIETLVDSVSLDTLEVLQSNVNYQVSPTPQYEVVIKTNASASLWNPSCSKYTNGPGNVLYTSPTVYQENTPHQSAIVKIPVGYLFATAGKYWITMEGNNIRLFTNFNCSVSSIDCSEGIWSSPQLDDPTNPYAKALNSLSSAAQAEKYGAFFNIDFTLRKFCQPTNTNCERILVEGDAPTTAISMIKSLNKCIYPNPTEGITSLSLPGENIEEITISNLAGKEWKITLQGGKIDLSNLPKGIYSISLRTNQNNYTEKIVIH